MYLSINFVGKYISNDMINIIVKVFLGAIIYIVMNIKFILSIIGGKNKTDETEKNAI